MERPLSVSAWLGAPALFAAAVVGLTGAGGLVLRADWPVTLPSWLCGSGAALAIALAESVAWRSPAQRRLLAVGYPLILLGLGLLTGGVALPLPVAMALGLPGAVVLVGVVLHRLAEPTPPAPPRTPPRKRTRPPPLTVRAWRGTGSKAVNS
ncbi:hypothetical protein [Actinokineospora pegani]|uniref:hypothetical protein n=1 Tax=Actinokineospora pegani TaxID=2654637 RepID=UPI0012E995C9|nr:hypothetical protein [Actinokineospora pegani]